MKKFSVVNYNAVDYDDIDIDIESFECDEDIDDIAEELEDCSMLNIPDQLNDTMLKTGFSTFVILQESDDIFIEFLGKKLKKLPNDVISTVSHLLNTVHSCIKSKEDLGVGVLLNDECSVDISLCEDEGSSDNLRVSVNGNFGNGDCTAFLDVFSKESFYKGAETERVASLHSVVSSVLNTLKGVEVDSLDIVLYTNTSVDLNHPANKDKFDYYIGVTRNVVNPWDYRPVIENEDSLNAYIAIIPKEHYRLVKTDVFYKDLIDFVHGLDEDTDYKDGADIEPIYDDDDNVIGYSVENSDFASYSYDVLFSDTVESLRNKDLEG